MITPNSSLKVLDNSLDDSNPLTIALNPQSKNQNPENIKKGCPKCDVTFYFEKSLLEHIEKSFQYPLKCFDCNFTSCTNSGLSRHRKEAHESSSYSQFARKEEPKNKPESTNHGKGKWIVLLKRLKIKKGTSLF